MLLPTRRRLLVIAGAAAALYAGCSDSPTAPSSTAIPSSLAPASATAITGTVSEPVSERPAVIVLDQNGNPMFGVQVTFSVESGGGTLTDAAVFSNTQGVATVGSWTLGPTVGTQTLIAAAGTLTPVTFTATAEPGTILSLSVSAGDGQSATVATAVAVPPAVLVVDQNDNPVPDVVVTFAVASGGGSVTGATAITTDVGIATVGSWTLGTTPGENTLTATADGVQVTFTATATAGAPATMTTHAGDGQTAVVGTAVAVEPAVRITDAHGNPVAGVAVEFEVESGGGAVTGAMTATDANGVATVGSWTLGVTAGANALTATAGALNVTFNATGIAAQPANIGKHAGDGQTAVAGSAVAVAPAVRITDAHGNPVAGVTVTFAVASGGGSVTGESPVTDAAGVATVGSWTLGTTAGPNALTAAWGSLNATFTATGVAGAPANMVKHAGDAQPATVGTAVAIPPAVRITDANGNPVNGVTVTFEVASGGGSVSGDTPATDADGVATVGSWTLGTVAGSNTLTATAGTLEVIFSATAEPGAPTQMTIAAGDNQSAVVGTAVLVPPAVRLTDTFGNDVPGVTVTFEPAPGSGSVTGGTPTTNGSGVATVGSWTLGTAVGQNTLTATAGDLDTTFVANATPGAPAVIEKIEGDNQTATVGTDVMDSLRVRVIDGFGNPVPGVTVTFTVMSGSGSVTDGVQVTDADGIATVGSWTLGTTAGENMLMATANGVVATFTATGTAGAPESVAVEAGDGQSATVNTEVGTDPAVLVTDQHGNPVPGVNVTFAIASGAGSISGAAQEVQATNAAGIATVTSWKLGTAAGSNTLTATATGLLPVTFTATGTPGPVAGMIKVAGDIQTQPAGSVLPIAPSVRLLDQFLNSIPGITVMFAIEAGGGTVLEPVQVVSGSDGIATVGGWQLGPNPGPNTLRATASGSFADFSADGT